MLKIFRTNGQIFLSAESKVCIQEVQAEAMNQQLRMQNQKKVNEEEMDKERLR